MNYQSHLLDHIEVSMWKCAEDLNNIREDVNPEQFKALCKNLAEHLIELSEQIS